MYRKCCMSCLLVSGSHTEVCKRCGYGEFSTVDDYVDQEYLNESNKSVIFELESMIETIKKETRAFDKLWCKLWGSDEDMDFDLISSDDQKDFTNLSYDLNNF